MAFTFIKYVPMLDGEVTVSSSIYLDNWYQQWLYTSANYDGTVQIYFEADISINNASYVLSVGIADSSSNLVSDSILTTSSTSLVRVRSGDLAGVLSTGTTYHLQYKNNSATPVGYVKNARLIIKQSGTVTKTEQYINLYMNGGGAAAGTAYADITEAGTFTFDSDDEFDGSLSIYLEATLYSTNSIRTAYVRLVESDGDTVANAEISSNATYTARVRSSAITLVNGTTYKPQTKYAGTTGTISIRCIRIIIVQDGGTKSACYNHLKFGTFSSYSTTDVGLQNTILWDEEDWTDSNKTVYHEGIIRSGSGNTVTLKIEKTDGTDISSLTTTSTSKVVVRSAAVDMSSYDDASVQSAYKSSTFAQYAYIYGHQFVVLVELPAVNISLEVDMAGGSVAGGALGGPAFGRVEQASGGSVAGGGAIISSNFGASFDMVGGAIGGGVASGLEIGRVEEASGGSIAGGMAIITYPSTSIVVRGLPHWHKGEACIPTWDLVLQPNKWGYLNNPEWDHNDTIVNYDSNPDDEPVIWPFDSQPNVGSLANKEWTAGASSGSSTRYWKRS